MAKKEKLPEYGTDDLKLLLALRKGAQARKEVMDIYSGLSASEKKKVVEETKGMSMEQRAEYLRKRKK
jgi:hypothetical protein